MSTNHHRTALSVLAGLAGVALSLGTGAPAQEPVKLGTHAQLVIDDAMIAMKEGVVRKTHACRKLPAPVLAPERPWEGLRIYTYGTVLHDAEAGQYRMWYMTRNETPAEDPRLAYARADLVLYATSRDGLAWTRPSLGLYEYGGSKENNIVFGLHSPSVLLDRKDPDPQRRYKMLGYGKSGGTSGYCAATSPDGFHWTGLPGNPVLPHGDTITLAYDSARGDYLAFHKRPGQERGYPRRMVYLATSRDFQAWSTPQLVLAPDEQDDAWANAPEQRTEFYNMSAFEYGGQFLGLVTVFKKTRRLAQTSPGQSPDDGPIDVQLVHSRDGRHWQRCEDRRPVIPNGPYPYDAGCILGVSNTPVFAGDEVWLYYTAITTTHGGALPEKKITVARAAWPRDRFVSLEAEAEGQIETASFIPSGNRLRVNAAAPAGSIAVEVLGDDCQVMAGYSAGECRPLVGDSLDHDVQWKEHETLPAGRLVRLRFYLQRASLFSFTVDG
jgi:hypothetical protein